MAFMLPKKLFVSAQFWVLISLLAFVCLPLTFPIKWPYQFFVKQTFDFSLWAATFYLNAYVLVPKTVFKGRILLFITIVLLALIAIVFLDNQFSRLINLPGALVRVFHYKKNSVPDIGNYILLIVTLIVFGISTVVPVVQRFQSNQLREQVLENEKTITELSFLKTQINPHFFFNVLHTIYALIETDAANARDAVYTLSHMMRYVLYETKNDMTTLAKELAFLEDYIKLMKIRLPDTTQVVFKKPQTVPDIEISPMLFLPYIENAFKHGTSTVHPGYIYIEIGQRGDDLLFEIHNPLFNDIASDKEESNGIGLKNTERRLNLIYPGRHELLIEKNETAHEFIIKLKINTK